MLRHKDTGILFEWGAIALILLTMLMFGCHFGQPQHGDMVFVETQTGKRVAFKVEVARTAQQQQKGLMEREYLDKNSGMVFLHHPPDFVSMWMKNTQISLDMIFISSHGIISKIAKNTVPYSRAIISSEDQVAAVLEINAGLSDEYGFKPGDKVEFGFD